jgi:hypothetical protein
MKKQESIKQPSTVASALFSSVAYAQVFSSFLSHLVPMYELQSSTNTKKSHHICKTLSQQKHIVLQSTAPLQLKRFKVGSKMAIAASAPVLPNQKKQCRKIARFTDVPCITV